MKVSIRRSHSIMGKENDENGRSGDGERGQDWLPTRFLSAVTIIDAFSITTVKIRSLARIVSLQTAFFSLLCALLQTQTFMTFIIHLQSRSSYLHWARKAHKYCTILIAPFLCLGSVRQQQRMEFVPTVASVCFRISAKEGWKQFNECNKLCTRKSIKGSTNNFKSFSWKLWAGIKGLWMYLRDAFTRPGRNK